jgi:hypothetical protein
MIEDPGRARVELPVHAPTTTASTLPITPRASCHLLCQHLATRHVCQPSRSGDRARVGELPGAPGRIDVDVAA